MDFIAKIFQTLLKIVGRNDFKEKELELFDVEKYKKPKHPNYKRCPNCGLESHTNEDIQKDFGVMHIDNYTYIQSWCRECRKGHASKEKKDKENIDLFN